eukprot:TRINITY_DN1687_c0_g1_i1.p1 TRINITY_DN1687_c0_g1~~TRINITY_DN1687_c0_g1_i1.p1  ORF type:complete len:375 (-),score=42.05 TRINITY_DN1687_c0_g1_i1:49-1113(-)
MQNITKRTDIRTIVFVILAISLMSGISVFIILSDKSFENSGNDLHIERIKTEEPKESEREPKESEKVLVFYAIYNIKEYSPINFKFFYAKGVYCNDPRVDYVFLNVFVPEDKVAEKLNLNPLKCSNVYIIERPNEGYDFGAYLDGSKFVKEHETLSKKTYNWMILFNGSVRGPFLEKYTDYVHRWWEIFTEKFVGNIGLVGTTINCAHLNLPHVQSPFLVMKPSMFEALVKKGLIRAHYNSFSAAIHAEVAISGEVINMGYNIFCMLHEYSNHDWIRIYKLPRIVRRSHMNAISSPYNPRWGRKMDEEEIVFIKVNRVSKVDNSSNVYMERIVNKSDIAINNFIADKSVTFAVK